MGQLSDDQKKKVMDALVKYKVHNRIDDVGSVNAIRGSIVGGAAGAAIERHSYKGAGFKGAAIGTLAGGLAARLGSDVNEALKIRRLRKEVQSAVTPTSLSAKLDDLIEFKTKGMKGIKPSEAVNNIRNSMRKHMHPTTSKIIQGAKKKAIQGGVPGDAGGASMLSAKLDQLIQLGSDPRPRNSLGMFADQQEGVADPNAMVKTYRSSGVLSTAALAGAGGALGAEGAKSGLRAIAEKLKKIRSK